MFTVKLCVLIALFDYLQIKLRHIKSSEKPQISHSNIVEREIDESNEVFMNEKALILHQLVGDSLNALLTRDANSDDKF